MFPETEKITQYDSVLSKSFKPRTAEDKNLRFARPIWLAFLTPIPDRKTRYAVMSEPIEVVDLDSDEGVPDNYVQIDLSTQSEGDEYKNTREIYNSIISWCDANNLDPNLIKVRKTASSRSNLAAHNLLYAMLDALTAEDMRRVSMPLDIVKKLTETNR